MDFDKALETRQFFKFTGPPEHWLTAIKYGTWALNKEHLKRWKEIQTGDIFLIHSSAGMSSSFRNAKSGIIGIGVVGFNFSVNENLFWYSEIRDKKKEWPLMVPITEFYLFSELSDPDKWGPLEPGNESEISGLVEQLVSGRVPVSEIRGFPPMGSFSSVSISSAQQVLSQKRPLYLYSRHSKRGVIADEEKPSDLAEVKNAGETLRSAASLRFLESINQRLIKSPHSMVTRDNDILARAEASHYSVLQSLIDIFRKKGYDTLSNKHVDLFAHDSQRSFLFEVKSTENRNFRVQARKGVVQLYEYDYFEITKFKKEKNINFRDQYRVLVPSQQPRDDQYVQFINSLDLGVAIVEGETVKPVGLDFGFSQI